MSHPPLIHRNIAHLRAQRGLTLSGLAERSGIAKSTLSQLESGEGNPTVDTLWAIANALDIPFGQLVDGNAEGASLKHGGIIVRFIERSTNDPVIEAYSVELRPHCRHDSVPHSSGVQERVTVLSGAVYVGPINRPRLLHAGDSHLFDADVPHFYASKDQGTRFHVVIEYPSKLSTLSTRTAYLDWPAQAEEWEGIRGMVIRMLIEVSNGLDARMLRFRGVPNQRAEAELRDRLRDIEADNFRWPLFFAVESDEQGLYVAMIRLQWVQANLNVRPLSKSTGTNPVAYGERLAELAASPGRALSESDLRFVREAVTAPSWTISTLAAEVLLQRGQVMMPSHIKSQTNRAKAGALSSGSATFSSRINVDHYDAFELLHPAYARQVIAVAQDIQKFAAPSQTERILDVGTGPGIPLLMLQEMHPTTRFTAIEPDNVAMAYLQSNTQHQPHIEALQTDFLAFDAPDASWGVITSVGASHHFNTAYMMQKALRLLQPGGLLVVADEFLPAFSNADERHRALVAHHGAYLLHAMQWLGDGEHRSTAQEQSLYRQCRRSMIQAWMSALEGDTAQAVTVCRSLDQQLRTTKLDKRRGSDLGAFIRFFGLELQAMAAGFDYEVEQKSYPQRFVELAAFAGLTLLNHRRVFATTGADAWGGGTHVFTFRKSGGDS